MLGESGLFRLADGSRVPLPLSFPTPSVLPPTLLFIMQGKRTRSFQDLAAGKVSAPEPRYSVTGHTTPQESVNSEADAKRSNLLASLMSQYLARGTLVGRSEEHGIVLWFCLCVGSGG